MPAKLVKTVKVHGVLAGHHGADRRYNHSERSGEIATDWPFTGWSHFHIIRVNCGNVRIYNKCLDVPRFTGIRHQIWMVA
jgi:hypothetical protein